MTTRTGKRPLVYPNRYFGRWLEDAVQGQIDNGNADSFRHFALKVGVTQQRMSDWRLGHTLPVSDEDRDKLLRYVGREHRRADLIRLEIKDRIDAMRNSLGLSHKEHVELAMENARDAA